MITRKLGSSLAHGLATGAAWADEILMFDCQKKAPNNAVMSENSSVLIVLVDDKKNEYTTEPCDVTFGDKLTSKSHESQAPHWWEFQIKQTWQRVIFTGLFKSNWQK